ncbi:Fe-S cluster assembly protein SufD [Methylocaldum szegediense]|uniref:Fe-S cluster assembly protein SufD n=1 Tax=Methylocaldum szegediense TaxID=73780 RepID=A0ABM9I2Z6_9GAMM|nr:Fe-S cluster assembly protein SufD [Methylocaldum szegediense]CAI8857213.1 Fe-S cluster assembly protein SufD [Methylocaldum szegediense]
MSAAQHYVEHYRALALPGEPLPWLRRLREEAQSRFSAGGFPSPREEEWKYTNVAALEKKLFVPTMGTPAVAADTSDLERLRLDDAWSLVFVDGMYSAEHSMTDGLPEGVIATSLASALERYPERIEDLFNQAVPQDAHGFIAFTTAYFRDGAFVLVPAGTILDKPLQLIHFSTRPDGLAVTRNLIALEQNAEASLVETYAGAGDLSYLSASVTEVSVGENAGLEHYKLQSETVKGYHFGGIYALEARSARFRQHHLAFGGLVARTEIHAQLDHEAACELDGLFLATGRRHLDTHTLIRHKAPCGTSRETYRGIAANRARGVFSGRIVVHPEAQKTDAEMSNRNLLLSEDAEIDSKPQLEIHADDVKCSHGVTVGQLDPEAVFYLESRGVDEATARNMLIFAFANEMVEKIGLNSLRRIVHDELLSFLPQSNVRKDWL